MQKTLQSTSSGGLESSERGVRAFRLPRIPVAAADGMAVAILIAALKEFAGGSSRTRPLMLELSRAQKADATSYFLTALASHLSRTPRGQPTSLQGLMGEGLLLPRSKLAGVLHEMGLEYKDAQANAEGSVDMQAFFESVKQGTLSLLTVDQVKSLQTAFNSMDPSGEGRVGLPALSRFLSRSAGSEEDAFFYARSIIGVWGANDSLSLDELGSCFATYMKFCELDEAVESDWTRMASGPEDSVTMPDLIRVLDVSPEVAREMIWEADVDQKGRLSLHDLLLDLATDWDERYETQTVPQDV